MKRFFALVALVLGLAACQTEPEGLDVQMGGEVDATITVSIPETETRAGGTNSAGSIFDNVDLTGTNGTDYTVRYIFEVYYGNTGTQKQVYYTDGENASFPVRLVPNRHYNFVAWADIVEQPTDDKMNKALPYEDTDVYYETSDLTNITLIGTWSAMDETRDAFTGYFNTATELPGGYTGASSINITLTRPFAKLRVITTDMVELGNLGITPVSAKVTYSAFSHESFNALDGTYSDTTVEKTHTYAIADYADQTGANKVLFTDYFFADDSDVVKFQLDVYESAKDNQTDATRIKYNNFNTDIAVQRNYLTTIKGNILTDGNNVKVTIDKAFENVNENGDTTDPNYEYKTISSDAEFRKALITPGQYIVISNIHIANAGDTVNTSATPGTSATRANAGADQTTVINLNGYTITLQTNITIAEGKNITITDINENGETGAIVSKDGGAIVNNGTLKIEGGNIESNSTNDAPAIVNNGTLNIEGGELEAGAITNNGTTNIIDGTVNEGAIENNGTTNVEGGVIIQGAVNNAANGKVTITNDNIDNNVVTGTEGEVTNYAKGLEDAFENGGEYTLGADVTLNKSLTLDAGKTLTLNLGGKTITGTDASTGSFGLITNRGNLTITGEGKMTLKAENNRAWNAYSSVISNTVGGKLVVENGTIEHLGGTDMAYGIDNLTNGKGTYAETVINGGTIKSPYRAIRQFLNGTEAQNILTVNGGVIEGANKSIWMQDPSAKANTGTLVVKEGATLNGDVYLFVCAGSTTWPVSVSIAASAVNGNVLTGNVPEGYAVVEENGAYVVKAYEVVANGLYKKDAKTYLVMNAEGLVALSGMTIKGGEIVTLGADIDLTDVEFNGLNAFNPENGNTFDGQNHIVSNWTYTGKANDMGFIKNWVGSIKNLTIKDAILRTGGRSAVIAAKPYGNIENCHVEDCNLQANYWACGLITGMHNSGNIKNCSVNNSYIYSTGGTGAITGVLNETAGTRTYENCEVSNCTINNGGNDPYSGAAIIGLVNIDNASINLNNCTNSNNSFEGTAKNELYGYNEGDNTTITIK